MDRYIDNLKRLLLIVLLFLGVILYSYPNKAANQNWYIELYDDEYTYNGKVKTPEVCVMANDKIYNELNGFSETDINRLSEGTEEELDSSLYEIVWPKGRKNVGKYKVTVKLKNGEIGSASFKIIPKETKIKSSSNSNNSITIKWTKIKKQITGYQIRYSTKKNMKSAKSITIKKSTKTKKKIKGLKEGKKYYFQIRTYKTVSGKKYYSDWSETKKCKTSSNNASSSTKESSKTNTTDSNDNSDDSGDVWVTENGKKYHSNKSCSRMKNPYKISKSKAESEGYTPCSKCY